VSVAVLFTPPPEAVMVTEVLAVTAKVVIGNVAVLPPSGTTTDGGTVAAAVPLLDSATVKPPASAATFRVTVPVEAAVPTTVAGLTVTDDGCRTRSDRVAFRVVPANVAERVTFVVAVTVVVVTG
jgi:hypothetical protein